MSTHTHNTTKDNHKGCACHSGSQSWVRAKGASQGPPCMSFFQRGGYTRWAHSASKKHEVALYPPTCQGKAEHPEKRMTEGKIRKRRRTTIMVNGYWALALCICAKNFNAFLPYFLWESHEERDIIITILQMRKLRLKRLSDLSKVPQLARAEPRVKPRFAYLQ